MPSVQEELEALRKQSLAKTHATALRDKGGFLSTPEQEQAGLRQLTAQTRAATYTKDAKQTLAQGGSSSSTPQDLKFQRQLAARKRADKEKQKEAAANLHDFNKAKELVVAGSGGGGGGGGGTKDNAATLNTAPCVIDNTSATLPSTPIASVPVDDTTTPFAAVATTPKAKDWNDNDDVFDVPELEDVDDNNEDDIPTLTEDTKQTMRNELMTMPQDMATQEQQQQQQPHVQNRAEKKARKLLTERLSMRIVTGIARVTFKTHGNHHQGIFTISQPTVYEKNGAYVVFGEARQGGSGVPQQQQQQQAKAAQQLAAGTNHTAADTTATTAQTSWLVEEDQPQQQAADETGLDSKDIELVMQQAGCLRAKAVAALREQNGDLVNAIMALTR